MPQSEQTSLVWMYCLQLQNEKSWIQILLITFCQIFIWPHSIVLKCLGRQVESQIFKLAISIYSSLCKFPNFIFVCFFYNLCVQTAFSIELKFTWQYVINHCHKNCINFQNMALKLNHFYDKICKKMWLRIIDKYCHKMNKPLWFGCM